MLSSENYEGNEDIYTIPTDGGSAKRITYHPSAELLCDWTADGRLLYSSDAYVGLSRQSQLISRGIDDPLPQRLPVPYEQTERLMPRAIGWHIRLTAMIIELGNATGRNGFGHLVVQSQVQRSQTDYGF